MLAAHSGTEVLRNRASGTSMAAAAVTGVVALMFEAARRVSIDLWAAQVRDILTKTAQKDPPFLVDWDPRYGHGRVPAAEAVKKVERMAPATGLPPPLDEYPPDLKQSAKRKAR